MRTLASIGIVAAFAVLIGPGTSSAAISGLERVASGLSAPIFVTHAPGDRDRLFIAQRGGAIRILDLNTGVLQATPFLSMSGLNLSGEGGFLGLAFHPDYSNVGMPGYGKFYVNVTTSGSPLTTRIREFQVSAGDPNIADPSSLREVLSIAQPQANHNGGWIGFSPNDHYLYIATGDGGGGDDNDGGHTSGTGNAQDITANLLGKMLRIDPIDPNPQSGPNYAIPASNPFVGVTGDDEIWAYGLRNPFRDSFDRITGDLWIGDVGQDNREEIDYQPASSNGGVNYGWRLHEGDIPTPTGGVGGTCSGCTDPVYAYTHPNSTPPLSPTGYDGVLVTGGYVYRGPDPSLQGKYFFFDSRNTNNAADDNYWMYDPVGPAVPDDTVLNIDSLLTPDVGSVQFPVSFGEDAVGNLYIAYIGSGEVYRIATSELLPGDFDADGDVDPADYDLWLASFGGALAHPAAEGNGNDIADAADYALWRKNLGASVHAGAGAGFVVPEPITAVYLTQLIGLWLVGSFSRSCVTRD
jgi:glucose/arabinose dehydrogenase